MNGFNVIGQIARNVQVVVSNCFDFASGKFTIGGVQTYIAMLAEVLLSNGYGVNVYMPNGERRSYVDANGMTVVGVPNVPTIKELVRIVESESDCKRDILVFATSTQIVKTSFRHSIGIQHGIYWDTTTIHGRSFRSRRASTLARAVQAYQILNQHSCVSHMVCVDLNYVNWMRALSVANRLPYTYIPNFANTSLSVLERKDDGKTRIVFARRFEEIRGCGLLIDVMPRILCDHPEVELTIAGGGSLEAELHEAFDGNGCVSFARYDADESIAFHGQFDIALVPTIGSEGTSLSLLEAMAAGCAVVATDVGGMSNIVLSGHNGLLVRPEADDLYRAVSALVDDASLRERLARNARQTVEDSFSRERWADSWTGILKEFV